MIEIRGVCYGYGRRGDRGSETKKSAINNLNLDIENGSFVAIVGPSGSGKSTLSKLLNAIFIPTSGKIIVDGLDSADSKNVYDIRKTVGLVLQNPDNQIIGDTIEDDVAFALENMGVERLEMAERVANVLSLVGLQDRASDSPKNLSGGQKQLLAITGAIVSHPKYLILDESLSMLDASSQTVILNLLHKLNNENHMSVVLMTHNIQDAMDCDVVHVMENGTVKISGKPKDVLQILANDRSDVATMVTKGSLVIKIAEELRKTGFDLPKDIVTEEDLVKYLIERHAISKGSLSTGSLSNGALQC